MMAEYLDVVDDEDNVVGKALRSDCHEKNLMHRSVMFFIFDPDYRVLVNKRVADKEFFGGMWSIVLGGHVSSGQSYDEAVVREAEEEAGVESKPFKIGYMKKRLPQECENVMVYGFVTDGKPNLLADEIEYGEFMTLSEAEDKITAEDFIPETHDLLPMLRSFLNTISK